jgi:hypothetical protein
VLAFFHLGKLKHAVARNTRDNVKMQVEHCLPRARFRKRQNINALKTEGNIMRGDFLDGSHCMRQLVIAAVKNIAAVFFGHDERVPVRVLGNVQKREYIFIFINFMRGNFARDNFAKNTIVHIFSVKGQVYRAKKNFSTPRAAAHIEKNAEFTESNSFFLTAANPRLPIKMTRYRELDFYPKIKNNDARI